MGKVALSQKGTWHASAKSKTKDSFTRFVWGGGNEYWGSEQSKEEKIRSAGRGTGTSLKNGGAIALGKCWPRPRLRVVRKSAGKRDGGRRG